MLEVFFIFSKPNLILFFPVALKSTVSVGRCKGILGCQLALTRTYFFQTNPFFVLLLWMHFSMPGKCWKFLYFFQTKPYFIFSGTPIYRLAHTPAVFFRPNIRLLFLFLRLHFSLPGRCCKCSPGWRPACTCPSCWGQKSHRAVLSWRDMPACLSPLSSQPGKNGKIQRDIQTWICGWDLAEWLECLTANAIVTTVLGLIPASSGTVDSEVRQTKQFWIKYWEKKNLKIPLKQKETWIFMRMKSAHTSCGSSWIRIDLWSRIWIHTVLEIRFMFSQKWNSAALFPVPTFMYLWAIYIFPGSVCLFGCSRIGRLILEIHKLLTDTWMWKLGDRTS
jgi:hypothetical protein